MNFLFGRALNLNEQIQTKGNISDEDDMIHILNNLPEEYDVILDGLENGLTVIGENALTIDTIRKKLNHRYEKVKKKVEKHEKEKALSSFNKQYKQQCQRCGMHGHKPGNRRCPKSNNKKEENEKKNDYNNNRFEGICYHCGQKGHNSRDCRVQKNGYNKKFEKAEKAIDGDELLSCSLMRDNKKEKNTEKKVRFMENEK